MKQANHTNTDDLVNDIYQSVMDMRQKFYLRKATHRRPMNRKQIFGLKIARAQLLAWLSRCTIAS